MKILNILLICLVIIVGSVFLLNKKSMSHLSQKHQHSINGGDIVLMPFQQSDTIAVYHKKSQTFLFYGYPSSDSKNDGFQLMQIRSLNNDFQLAERLDARNTELEWNVSGYNVAEIKKQFK